MPSRRTQNIAQTQSYVGCLMDEVLNLNVMPNESTMMYATLQTMFRTNPERFRIISGIHKNNNADQLHFSVQVEIGTGFHQRFHFYVCQVNTDMKCYCINGIANNTRTGKCHEETVAKFYL